MRKIAFSFLALFCIFGIMACQKKQGSVSFPSEIRIVKKGGIAILPKPQSDVKPLSAAPQNYTYKVVDAYPGYYKIAFVNGQEGWIPAGVASKWTTREGNKVKVLIKGGLTVRTIPYDNKSASIGVAASMYTFDILETSYIYYKIQYPEKKQGWIYVGKPGDMWVEPVGLLDTLAPEETPEAEEEPATSDAETSQE